MTNREKIANGECVSPLTVDRCPVCIDRCEASETRERIDGLLEGTGVEKPKEDQK